MNTEGSPVDLGAEEITRESSLSGGEVDSLDRIEILIDLEEKFSIKIPDKEAEKFQTVKDVIEYVKKAKEE